MSNILTSMHGKEVGLDSVRRLVVPGGLRVGSNGSQRDMSGPSCVAIFDDFDGSAGAYSTTAVNTWLSRKGTTNAVDWTVTEAANGTVVGKVGDTTASMAVSGIQLTRGLNWKANMGELAFEARVKTGIITNIAIFVGFTDTVASLLMPIQSAASADTFTTNSSNACGFMFDTSMTTKDWWLTGVATDTDATMQDSTFAPVADTYETFRIEVSTTGAATFFRNGKQVGGTMTGAVTATTALSPCIAAFNRTTTNGATTIVTADYIHTSALRV